MNTITSSHLRTNNPPIISNGYQNWWDVAGQNPQQLNNVIAPSYGQYNQMNNFLPLTPINVLPKMPIGNGFLTPIVNKGCGCQGAK